MIVGIEVRIILQVILKPIYKTQTRNSGAGHPLNWPGLLRGGRNLYDIFIDFDGAIEISF